MTAQEDVEGIRKRIALADKLRAEAKRYEDMRWKIAYFVRPRLGRRWSLRKPYLWEGSATGYDEPRGWKLSDDEAWLLQEWLGLRKQELLASADRVEAGEERQ